MIVRKFEFIPIGIAKLEIVRSRNTVTLWWLSSFADFRLEQTESLGSGCSPVAVSPTIEGEVAKVSINAAVAARSSGSRSCKN